VLVWVMRQWYEGYDIDEGMMSVVYWYHRDWIEDYGTAAVYP